MYTKTTFMIRMAVGADNIDSYDLIRGINILTTKLQTSHFEKFNG